MILKWAFSSDLPRKRLEYLTDLSLDVMLLFR